MAELSIIVPVYRAEKFLEKCVGSILNQTLSDLELILVEDGSPDGSGAICDRLAEADSRIRVIHQANAGVSAARNRGLEAAGGDYVGFVDSDDWIDPRMYESLMENPDGDMIVCDVMTVYEDGSREPDTITQLPEDVLLHREDLSPRLMLELAGSACRCLYRRSLLEDNGIRFPVGLRFSEDRVFNLYAMGRADAIRYRKLPLYMRFVNRESCVNTFHRDYRENADRAAEETHRAIAAVWHDDPAYHQAYFSQYISVFLVTIENLRRNPGEMSPAACRREIRRICRLPSLQHALMQCGWEEDQWDLLRKKRVWELYYYDSTFCRKLRNFRETLAEGGIPGVIRKCLEKL